MDRFATATLIFLLCGACGRGSPTSPTSQIPDYSGNWQGKHVVQSCTETEGAVGNVCEEVLQSEPLPLLVTITQTGSMVTGGVRLDDVLAEVSGSVNESGVLTLSGQGRFDSPVVDGVVSIAEWRTTVSGTTMTGSFTWTIVLVEPEDASGSVRLTSVLQGVVKAG